MIPTDDAKLRDLLSKMSKLIQPGNLKKKYGWLFVGKREATFGYVQQIKPVVLKKITFPRSQRQNERLIEEAEIVFHRRICEIMNEFFLLFEDLQRIFVGGSGPIEETIDSRLEGKITFIAVSSDKGREGIQEFFTEIRKLLSK